MLEALCYYIDIKIFSFYKNDAFFEKYLAKSRVGARLFVCKGYSKGETQIRAYMKRDVLIISLSEKPRFLPKVPYETESSRVRSRHGGDNIRGNDIFAYMEKAARLSGFLI